MKDELIVSTTVEVFIEGEKYPIRHDFGHGIDSDNFAEIFAIKVFNEGYIYKKSENQTIYFPKNKINQVVVNHSNYRKN